MKENASSCRGRFVCRKHTQVYAIASDFIPVLLYILKSC